MKQFLSILLALYLTTAAVVVTHHPQPALVDGELYCITVNQSADEHLVRVYLPNEQTGLTRTIFAGVDDPTAVWFEEQVVKIRRYESEASH